MSDIEKYQIESNDDGYQVQAHDSIIMDDRFTSKFKNLNGNKVDVQIQYIKLDNILAENGAEIMEILSDKKYLDIMQIPFI